MRSTGDIQFFVCRSRIIPEPPFPSQGIAGSGNEIGIEAAREKALVKSDHMTPQILDIFVTWPCNCYAITGGESY